VRRLIINADDLGLTRGVNRGIVECIRQGVVTSTTLMANASAFDDAVGRLRAVTATANPGARETPPAGVGVHLTLVDGKPLSPPQQVSSLLADGADEFRAGFAGFALSALTRRLDTGQIAREVEAQIRKVQAAGVPVSHVDTHKHVHLLPPVSRAVLRVARACGIRAVRNPFAPLQPMAYAHLLRRPRLWKRYTEVRLLRGWAESFRRAAAAEGMITPDGTFGIVSTGALDLELFCALAGCIPEGTWELCCHPGYNDADLAQVRTRLRESRAREYEVLISPAAREALARHGIQLVSYWDIG